MSARESAEEINRAAAAWVVRVDRGDDSAIDAALADWLDGDRRRRGAFLRAQAIWRRIDHHDTIVAEPDEETSSPSSMSPSSMSRRSLIWGGVAGAAAAAVVLWIGLTRSTTYQTTVGEQRRERLADGSVMLLNTDSAGKVEFHVTRRLINLEQGEALFTVAKDKSRPFIVSAGAIRVEAVGTAFAVRKLGTGADVVVTSGRVRAWSERSPGRFVSINAGHRTYLSNASGADDAVVRSDGVDQALAWERGMIAIDGMTVVEAAAEFNRYNNRQVSVDAQFADRRLLGWFRAKDIDGFAQSAATIVGGRVEKDQNTLRIVR